MKAISFTQLSQLIVDSRNNGIKFRVFLAKTDDMKISVTPLFLPFMPVLTMLLATSVWLALKYIVCSDMKKS